ncbi:MAG TPA: hypothetical protein VNO21_22330 [Polyangiaceae bacterium]|nr:hypothetical protein [Polyangiaceae bacterium]
MITELAPRGVRWFLLPLLLLAFFLGAYWLAGSEHPGVVATGVLVGKLFTLAGFVLAASRFSWGDRLHFAWSLFALNMILLFGKDLCLLPSGVRCPGLDLSPEATRTALGIVLSIANIASTVATVLLARAWRESGMDIDPSKSHRIAKLAVVPLALAIFALGVRDNMQKLPSDMWQTITLVLIPVSDLVCVSLIGSLALTAYSLRGGALALPWAMFTLGNVFWVLWDLAGIAHLSGPFRESLRILALGYTGSAALEQWWVLRPHAQRE